jgi:hypothetical protein
MRLFVALALRAELLRRNGTGGIVWSSDRPDRETVRSASAHHDRGIALLGAAPRFPAEMIRNLEFVCRADDIVVEFGNSRLQGLADRYTAGEKVTEAELQSVWRETSVPLTWNSPVYRQFQETVR